MNCIIIDDENNNIENLQNILATWCPQVTVVATAGTVAEAKTAIALHQPNLLFLDIQLHDESGFDLLKALQTIDFEVIFVTAYDQYGIQAVKFSALDYLLKPIAISELQQAIAKAANKIANKQQNLNVENLLNFIQKTQKEAPKIALPTLQETRYVKVNEIVRCEASNNYTNFILQNGDEVLVCKTLKEFTELLKPYQFHRPHQSHLVNFHFVKSLLKEDGGTLLLDDQSKIPISRQNLESIKKALQTIG
ncbi:LytTR family DNA-binding domain-containing protein [Pedobacter sp. Hv1]|uniref:LytR/AlgR family response regulator transcription factor n=1 Tax=Pedobacter sp. Hv1 TaxID=1740090 RepID=UPI0006D8C24A|nr:LytTR family DNA-binding domain-containing protein [Pedobacter sp. Hv1]KQB98845.1 two-component system response regulator [Pedobacter sp. Hv1]